MVSFFRFGGGSLRDRSQLGILLVSPAAAPCAEVEPVAAVGRERPAFQLGRGPARALAFRAEAGHAVGTLSRNTAQSLPRLDAGALYNAAAVEVCKKHGVAIDDLCGYVLAHPDMMRKNNVHFFTAGYRALSDRVCNSLLKELDVRGK